MRPDPLVAAIRQPHGLVGMPLAEWDGLLRLARAANLLSKLAEVLAAAGLFERVPEAPRQHLLSARILSRHQRQAIEWELRHIGTALARLDIPLVLLKGAAYVHAGLPAATGRLFGDVDLMVPRAALPAVEAALMLKGWATDEADAYDQRYYREWMHELPPMVNRQRGTVIDVHHNVLPLTARAVPPAQALLDAARPLPGSRYQVLSPADMVIHSATHLFYEGEPRNGLRDLFDLDALLRHFAESEPGFWDALPARAEVLGLARPLYLGLRYCRHLLDTPIPPAVLARVEALAAPSRARTWMLDALYHRALRPDHPLAADGLTPMVRAALYLRGHALRMPLARLLPHLARKAALRLVKNDSRG